MRVRTRKWQTAYLDEASRNQTQSTEGGLLRYQPQGRALWADALVEVEEVEKEAPVTSESTTQVDSINDQTEDVGGRPLERCDFAVNEED